MVLSSVCISSRLACVMSAIIFFISSHSLEPTGCFALATISSRSWFSLESSDCMSMSSGDGVASSFHPGRGRRGRIWRRCPGTPRGVPLRCPAIVSGLSFRLPGRIWLVPRPRRCTGVPVHANDSAHREGGRSQRKTCMDIGSTAPFLMRALMSSMHCPSGAMPSSTLRTMPFLMVSIIVLINV